MPPMDIISCDSRIEINKLFPISYKKFRSFSNLTFAGGN